MKATQTLPKKEEKKTELKQTPIDLPLKNPSPHNGNTAGMQMLKKLGQNVNLLSTQKSESKLIKSSLMKLSSSTPEVLATPFWVRATSLDAKSSTVSSKTAAATPAASSPTGYTPYQIRSAYGFNRLVALGEGQLIAVIGAYASPTVMDDFVTFDREFKISPSLVNPSKYLKIHPMSSGISNDYEWGAESALDVQWIHAIAPRASILLVQAVNNYSGNFANAIQYAISQKADIVSMSWGFLESDPDFNATIVSDYDSYFTSSGGRVSFLAASGDIGYGKNKICWYPSSSPYVLSIAGTSLYLNSSGGYGSETAWDNFNGQSGGGPSEYESMPQWQMNYFGTSGQRQCPDFSFDGDPETGVPIYNSNDAGDSTNITGWSQYGGTSLSVLLAAGSLALTNQMRTMKQPVSYATTPSYLYNTMATYANYTTNFNSINNNTAYDNNIGLGTPRNAYFNSGFCNSLTSL
jgi:subtilase family serine protease